MLRITTPKRSRGFMVSMHDLPPNVTAQARRANGARTQTAGPIGVACSRLVDHGNARGSRISSRVLTVGPFALLYPKMFASREDFHALMPQINCSVLARRAASNAGRTNSGQGRGMMGRGMGRK